MFRGSEGRGYGSGATVIVSLLIFVITLTLMGGTASAGPIGDVEQLSTFGDSASEEIGWTSVAANPITGTALVLYFAKRSSGDGSRNYYAQVVGTAGTPIGPPQVIEGSPDNAYYSSAPTVAHNPATVAGLPSTGTDRRSARQRRSARN